MRQVVRSLRRHPAFTIAAVLTLAIAIAANSLIFCVVRSTLLRSLPFPDSDRLVSLWEHHPMLGKQEIAPPDFRDWRDQNQSFDGLAAYTASRYFEPLLGGVEPEKIGATLASRDLLPLLGVHPALGRNFLESEDEGGHNAVALVSDRLWRRRFHADPKLVGQSLDLNGEPYTIVGILPPQTRIPEWADVWLPLSRLDADTAASRVSHFLIAIGRLKPGVPIERASVDIGSIVERLRRDFPVSNGPTTFEMRPLQADLTGDVRSPLLVLMAAVGLVLLIASANVANLLLTRSAARQREIATRRALGATGFNLVRQFVAESWLLSLLGSLAGLLLADAGISWIRHLSAAVLPHPENIAVEWHAAAFAFVLSVFTTAIAALAPSIELLRARPNLQLNLRGGSMSPSQRRWQSVFMTSQIAIAVAVLIGAGLLVQSFRFLMNSDPGFHAERLLTFRIALSPTEYSADAAVRNYYDRLLARLQALPGVTAAATVNTPPLSPPSRGSGRFFVDVLPDPAPGNFPVAQIRVVSPDYFRAMGIPLQQGRCLRGADDATLNVVVNATLARRFFRSASPVGHNVVVGLLGPRRILRPIVGVVADTKDTGLQNESWPTFYFISRTNEATVLVRATSAPTALISAVQREVHALDPKQTVSDAASMEELMGDSVRNQRFSTIVFGLLAAIALLLAAIGTYGVVAHQTQRRIPELGIRIALGARNADVYRAVIGAGAPSVLTGIVAGAAVALAFNRLMRGMLFGVQGLDLATYLVTGVLMASVALAAMAVPARRATKIDPVAALRLG
jgi:putative ABC transport system permease protein